MLKWLLIAWVFSLVMSVINLIKHIRWKKRGVAASGEVVKLKSVYPVSERRGVTEIMRYEYDIKVTTDTGVFQSIYSEKAKVGEETQLEEGQTVPGLWDAKKEAFMPKTALKRKLWENPAVFLIVTGVISAIVGFIFLLDMIAAA